VLDIDIGGSTAIESALFQEAAGAGKSDLVNINQGAELNGKLALRLVENAATTAPAATVQYRIMNTGLGITGTFTNFSVANAAASPANLTGTHEKMGRVVLEDGLSSFLVYRNSETATGSGIFKQLMLTGYAADNEWKGGDEGDWNEAGAANWTAFDPNQAGQVAKFGTASTGGTVHLSGSYQTVGGLLFSAADRSYTLDNGTLALDNSPESTAFRPDEATVAAALAAGKFQAGSGVSTIIVAGEQTIRATLGLGNDALVSTTTGARLTLSSLQDDSSNSSLVKTGAGALVLSEEGTIGISGSIAVQEGVLALGGSSTISGTALYVGASGTLAGHGLDSNGATINAAATIAGLLTPGNVLAGGAEEPLRSLNFAGGLTLQNGAQLELAMSAEGNLLDQILIGDGQTLTLDDGANIAVGLSFGAGIDFADAFWSQDQEWVVFAAGASPGDAIGEAQFAGLAGQFAINAPEAAAALGAFSFQLVDSGAGQALKLVYNVAPIPEPGTWALLASGLSALALALRRRKP
jgi:hypothetical protein